MLKKLKARLRAWEGRFSYDLVTAVLYAGMLVLILLFFSGNGQFIYEAF